MAGSSEGGQKAALTNKNKYGPDFYRKIGVIGAEKYRKRQKEGIAKPRGFAANKELARIAGAKGGTISRRGKSNG